MTTTQQRAERRWSVNDNKTAVAATTATKFTASHNDLEAVRIIINLAINKYYLRMSKLFGELD
jgi:hypothetical protein